MLIDLSRPRRLVVRREVTDRKFYDGDSIFLHHVKKALHRLGYNCIKRLAWKDGHLVDNYMHYLRDRKYRWHIWDPDYAVRSLARKFDTDGEVTLVVETNDKEGWLIK